MSYYEEHMRKCESTWHNSWNMVGVQEMCFLSSFYKDKKRLLSS